MFQVRIHGRGGQGVVTAAEMLSVAAFLAGVLNAVAGGGSFLLFPAMLSMKMLPVQANANLTPETFGISY